VAWAEDVCVETLGEKLWGGSVAVGLTGGFGSLVLLLSPRPPLLSGGPATATWAGMAGPGLAAAALATASSWCLIVFEIMEKRPLSSPSLSPVWTAWAMDFCSALLKVGGDQTCPSCAL